MKENLLKSLQIMGLGMFGIFVVVCVLILCVYAFSAIDRKSNEKRLKKDEDNKINPSNNQ